MIVCYLTDTYLFGCDLYLCTWKIQPDHKEKKTNLPLKRLTTQKLLHNRTFVEIKVAPTSYSNQTSTHLS